MTLERQYYVFSQQTGIAALLSDDSTTIIVPARDGTVTTLPLDEFLLIAPDAQLATVPDRDDPRDAIAYLLSSSRALTAFLLLYDSDLSCDTRSELAAELTKLFTVAGVVEHVQDILFAAPLPEVASTATAREAAAGHGVVESLINDVATFQSSITDVSDSFHRVIQTESVSNSDSNAVKSYLLKNHVFVNLVRSYANGAHESFLTTQFASLNNDSEQRLLRSLIPYWKRALNAVWLTRNHSLLQGGRNTVIPVVESRQTENGHDSAELSNPRHRLRPHSQSAHQAKQQLDIQVARIVDFYSQSKDIQANQLLDSTLRTHEAGVGGGLRRVKTLCSIASSLSQRGRDDVRLRLLIEANGHPAVDSLAANLLASEYRRRGEWKRAVGYFERAVELLKDPDGTISIVNEVEAMNILDDMVCVLSSIGQYEKAIAQWKSLSAWGDQGWKDRPKALTRVGHAHRKLGQVRQARECFVDCLNRNRQDGLPMNHFALAGLAEIRRQQGDPHGAIRIYNRIISDPMIEVGSQRIVYNIARASLLRRTRQHTRALSLIEETLRTSGRNRWANIEYALILECLGQQPRAAEIWRRVDDLDRISSVSDDEEAVVQSVIERSATGVALWVAENAAVVSAKNEENWAAREFRAIGASMAYLREKEAGKAAQQIVSVNYIDRAMRDLAAVISFHAARMSGTESTSENELLIRTIAKRGDPDLRSAIGAAEAGNFENAIHFELQFLRLAA